MAPVFKTIPSVIHWLASLVIIGLSSAVLYFVKDMHSDFKAMQKELQDLRVSDAQHTTAIKYLTDKAR